MFVLKESARFGQFLCFWPTSTHFDSILTSKIQVLASQNWAYSGWLSAVASNFKVAEFPTTPQRLHPRSLHLRQLHFPQWPAAQPADHATRYGHRCYDPLPASGGRPTSGGKRGEHPQLLCPGSSSPSGREAKGPVRSTDPGRKCEKLYGSMVLKISNVPSFWIIQDPFPDSKISQDFTRFHTVLPIPQTQNVADLCHALPLETLESECLETLETCSFNVSTEVSACQCPIQRALKRDSWEYTYHFIQNTSWILNV